MSGLNFCVLNFVLNVVVRKLRRAAREKRKLRDKMALNMIIPGDTITQTDDIALFNLRKIKSKHVSVWRREGGGCSHFANSHSLLLKLNHFFLNLQI